MSTMCILFKSGDRYQAIDEQGLMLAYSTNRQEVLNNVIENVHVIFVDSSFKESNK